MLEHISSVTRNECIDAINAILVTLTSGTDSRMMAEMYEITLIALKSGNSERLWFNTYLKLAELKLKDKKFLVVKNMIKLLYLSCDDLECSSCLDEVNTLEGELIALCEAAIDPAMSLAEDLLIIITEKLRLGGDKMDFKKITTQLPWMSRADCKWDKTTFIREDDLGSFFSGLLRGHPVIVKELNANCTVECVLALLHQHYFGCMHGVVSIVGVDLSPQQTQIVVTEMVGDSLDSIMSGDSTTNKLFVGLDLLWQVASTMVSIHALGRPHCNIKASSIMTIEEEGRLIAKLGEFRALVESSDKIDVFDFGTTLGVVRSVALVVSPAMLSTTAFSTLLTDLDLLIAECTQQDPDQRPAFIIIVAAMFAMRAVSKHLLDADAVVSVSSAGAADKSSPPDLAPSRKETNWKALKLNESSRDARDAKLGGLFFYYLMLQRVV
jgi:hypothetical protein